MKLRDGRYPLKKASLVIMLPTILLYVFFRRHIPAGVAAGAVKE